MLCRKISMVPHSNLKRTTQLPQLKVFVRGSKAATTILCAMLFPVLLNLMIYFENVMEVKYVSTETQALMDFAVKGAATTGKGVKAGDDILCMIPYDDEDKENSGYHVARKIIRTNLFVNSGNLPENARASIWAKITDDEIDGFNTKDTDVWASGKAKIDLTYSYQPTRGFFGQTYRVHTVSVAKCYASSDSSSKDDHLNACNGVFYGPSGKETYYNLDMSGVIEFMRNGTGTEYNRKYPESEYPYSVRSDGVKMLGKYVMVAANLSVHPRGSIVNTSLGKGIVVDTGSFAATNPNQLDIATNWTSATCSESK